MKPEIYAAVRSFLGQGAVDSACPTAPSAGGSPSDPNADVNERAEPTADADSTRQESPSHGRAMGSRAASMTRGKQPNESIRVALKQRDRLRLAAHHGRYYLRRQSGLEENKIPFAEPVHNGDTLVSALTLKWLTSDDLELRDHLLGQAPEQLVPAGRPLSQDHLDRTAHWLIACRRAGRMSPSQFLTQSRALLASIDDGQTGPRDTSPAWDTTTSAVVLEAVLPSLRGEHYERCYDAVQPLLLQVESHLVSGSFMDGTENYPIPEMFLCQVSELWRGTTPHSAALRIPLEAAIRERWWSGAGPVREPTGRRALALAALLIAAENLHLKEMNLDAARADLIQLQNEEGAFQPMPFRRVGAGGHFLGSRSISTLFAVRALDGQPRCGGWGNSRQWKASVTSTDPKS